MPFRPIWFRWILFETDENVEFRLKWAFAFSILFFLFFEKIQIWEPVCNFFKKKLKLWFQNCLYLYIKIYIIFCSKYNFVTFHRNFETIENFHLIYRSTDTKSETKSPTIIYHPSWFVCLFIFKIQTNQNHCLEGEPATMSPQQAKAMEKLDFSCAFWHFSSSENKIMPMHTAITAN